MMQHSNCDSFLADMLSPFDSTSMVETMFNCHIKHKICTYIVAKIVKINNEFFIFKKILPGVVWSAKSYVLNDIFCEKKAILD